MYTSGLLGSSVKVPHVPNWAEPVWHLYVVRSTNRVDLQQRLSSSGVGTLIHYPVPPHMQAAYSALGLVTEDFPVAEMLASEILSLPIGPQLEFESVRSIILEVRQ
jgi:dTDP-4-amino-4,6-dideoxygalactose transaminase